MKYTVLIFFTFFYVTLFGQLRDSIQIKTTIFDVVYSEKLQQPKWIEYSVLCNDGTISRKGLDFYTCDSIVTSDNKDYENNEWDKGHLAPAADFNCNKNHLYQTFTYLNCVLQHEKLNRGTWRLLEAYERELSKKYTVYVEIRMVYSTKSKKLSTGATVPDAFIKTIRYNNITEIYYFKNEIPLSNDFTKYRIKKY
jgi:endonuclease G